MKVFVIDAVVVAVWLIGFIVTKNIPGWPGRDHTIPYGMSVMSVMSVMSLKFAPAAVNAFKLPYERPN